MEAAPRIAIIVPTYNRAALVGAAVGSALAQDVPVAVVVVDDASSDGTGVVLDDLARDERVLVVRHPNNRGPSAAKNTGLDHVPPDCAYFGILDSDDRLEPGALRALVGGFRSSPAEVSQVFGWCRDPGTGELTGHAPAPAGLVTLEDAACGRFAGEFWQLARVDLLGARRFDERSFGGEGWLWWRLLRDAPGRLVADVVRLYDRSGADRVSNTSYDRTVAAGRMWAYRRILEEFGPEIRAACAGHYGSLMAEAAKWAMLADDRAYARLAAGAALRHQPSSRTAALAMAQLLPAPVRALLLRRWRGGEPRDGRRPAPAR